MENLLKFGTLPKIFETLTLAKCSDETECLSLKASLWAIGHVSTSTEGVELLSDPASHVYEKIIYLAKHSEVYSVRATALHVLGLVGSTKAGANLLFKFGKFTSKHSRSLRKDDGPFGRVSDWLCVRHNRNTLWPVCESEDWLSKHLTPIRHHIDKVPPYNYTGLDDNINGLFGTLDESASFYIPESGETSKEDDASEVSNRFQIVHGRNWIQNLPSQIDGPVTTTISTSKSRTLPDNSSKYSILKHKRSLSESKTTDGISLASINYYSGRTRFNSGTDSNTSGVSSYESVFAVATSDMCKTLSPIPSSSNLLEVKKPNERFRRISLTGASFRESTISSQDAQGYAKLRLLRRYQRPMLSESAADELADIIDTNVRLTGKGGQTPRLKVRSLDRHSNLIDIDGMNDTSLSSGANVSYVPAATYTRGPCYLGICMPKNILDLFPAKVSNGTYVSRWTDVNLSEFSVSTKQQATSDFVSECEESSVSSLSDISSTTSKRSKTASNNKHNRSQCLLCCRGALSTSIPSLRDFRANNISRFSSSTVCEAGQFDEVDGPRSSSTLIATRGRDAHNSSAISSTEISDVSMDGCLSDDNSAEKIRATVLRHVQRMGNPIWSKQSKIALFKMKQRHHSIFQDVCLYSEICKALSGNAYRLSARRYLQELFFDVDYSTFYDEAVEIIKLKQTVFNINGGGRMFADHSDDASKVTAADRTRSNNVSVITASPIPPVIAYTMKPQLLKSPPLASVHETSRENLSESLGTNPSKSIERSAATSNGCLSNCIDTKATIEFTPSESDSGSVEMRKMSYSRPRFNTLELDLSCTKNKFPITDRRKSYNAPSSVSNNALYSKRITKSLSSSITAPTNLNLYCEKRLKTSKSEAILTNNNLRHSYTFGSSGQQTHTSTSPTHDNSHPSNR